MKKRDKVKIICAFAILLFVAFVMEQNESGIESSNKIKRRGVGEGNEEIELIVNTSNGLSNYSYKLDVQEEKISREQALELIEHAKEEIDETFYTGEDCALLVRNAVNPCKKYQNDLVQADWYFDHYEVIDFEGEIHQEAIPEEGILIQAMVNLDCYGYSAEYQFSFHVFPIMLESKEQIVKQISKQIEQQQSKVGEQYIFLPEEVDGVRITWDKTKEYLVLKVLLLEAIIVLLINVEKKEKQRKQQKEREKQLQIDYPEMVGKLTVLIGAGMSIKQSWNSIVSQYESHIAEKNFSKRLLYDEMMKTNREIHDGQSESIAYQQFAERTGLQMYRRFSRILLQNMSKGSQCLGSLLSQESERAYIERRNLAKKLGEEAGTKLLFPMMLLLAIVMVIVLAPAIFSFNI